MRTSFHHQSEAQPPNGPLTAATSPDTPSAAQRTTFRFGPPELGRISADLGNDPLTRPPCNAPDRRQP
jgi:hypothetical protein